MGKEVVVHGYVSIISPDLDKDGYLIRLVFDPRIHMEREVSCTISQGQPADGLLHKPVTVKGKIINIHSQNYMFLKSIQLDPCELRVAE